ncbi:MerR family transcriptional regulator [Amycolatopsis granulosa]|uniref:MerR family transcriptional regulator n=1 Tax=Amycolatopsis granulosa TaxID=185684 RepID=UPI001ABB4D1F|nr:MerR family transcriptional regulator [Amycolatopsis granulosa]NIH86561.1 DNA-binding transcriptional MerR regulator [Amycolatopsis granulosa]
MTAHRRTVGSGELAAELGLSRRSISRYAERGWIKPALVTPGGQYRWDVEDVRNQLEALRDRHTNQRRLST